VLPTRGGVIKSMLIGHKKQWEFLKKKFEQDQLSHAYLFTGQKGIGKKLFAKELAKLVNCESENRPCQKCFSCVAIEKESFPDFMVLREANEKDYKFGDGGEIKISQIRAVQNFLSYKSYYGKYKIVIVEDAEKMNVEAQSCFLKTLEEPKGQTLLIVISSKPDMLLGTIASRCQTVKFFRPNNLPQNNEKVEREKEILNELLPVMNSSFAEKFKYTKAIDFEKRNFGEILEVLQKYFRRLLLSEVGVNFGENVKVGQYQIHKIKDIINLLGDINNKFIFTNASPKLALEILLLEL